jgi:N-methylhydantoinase B
VTAVVFGDGVDEEARGFGIFGGRPGSLNALVITDPDGRSHRPRSKEIVRGIRRGSVVLQRAGGGGGYGDPRERPVEEVLADVRNGLVSVARARDDYGVVVDPVSKEFDVVATRQLRENSA